MCLESNTTSRKKQGMTIQEAQIEKSSLPLKKILYFHIPQEKWDNGRLNIKNKIKLLSRLHELIFLEDHFTDKA